MQVFIYLTSTVSLVDPSSTLLLAWTFSCPTPLLFDASQATIVIWPRFC